MFDIPITTNIAIILIWALKNIDIIDIKFLTKITQRGYLAVIISEFEQSSVTPRWEMKHGCELSRQTVYIDNIDVWNSWYWYYRYATFLDMPITT